MEEEAQPGAEHNMAFCSGRFASSFLHRSLYLSISCHFIPFLNKGVVTPAPESEWEYHSRPFSTPDYGTGSFASDLMVSVPWLELALLLDLKLLLEIIYFKHFIVSHHILRISI